MKLKTYLQGLLLTICLSQYAVTYAAQKVNLYGDIDINTAILKKFSLIQTLPMHEKLSKKVQLPQDLSDSKNNINTFQLIEGHMDTYGKSHTRYDQFYRGIPVFGMQIIYCVSSSQKTTVTGSLIEDIEQDVPDINNSIPVSQVKKIALGKNPESSNLFIRKIIYLDENSSDKAILAYLVSYPVQTRSGLALLYSIIDANNGNKLKEWNGLTIDNKY